MPAASSPALVERFAALYSDESAGLMVEIALSPGDYEMPTLELNSSVVASGVSLVAAIPDGESRRLAASDEAVGEQVVLRPEAGGELLRTSPGAPALQMRGLHLQGPVHVDGSHASFELCTFRDGQATEGGALAVVGGGVVEATACNFTSNNATRGGALLVALPVGRAKPAGIAAATAAGHLGMNVAVFEPLKMIGGMGAAGNLALNDGGVGADVA